MKNELVYNAIQTPDGTIIESVSQHDCKFYTDKNGKTYMIDGGVSGYSRRSAHGDEISLCVYSDEPFEKVRQFAFRNSGGKDGKSSRLVRIKDMSDNYLENAIKYFESMRDVYSMKIDEVINYQILLKEKEYRFENNIKIKEVG